MTTRRHGTEQEWTLLYYNELSAETRTTLQDHLRHCDACRDSYDHLHRTLSALPRLQPPLDAAARERFVARVSRRRTPLWRQHPALGGLLTTALAAVVAVILWPGVNLTPPPSAPSMTVGRAAEQSTAAPRMLASKSLAADNLNLSDLDVVEQMDLLQNLDVLSQWDLVQDMES